MRHGATLPTLNREAVFSAATTEGKLAAAQLYVAASAWGTGPSPQGVVRRIRPLTPDPARFDTWIRDALDVLHSEGPVAAYRLLNNAGHIKHLGPAFFTKVLYFAGYRSDRPGLRPLIMDQYVVKELNRRCNFRWRSTGWSTDQYEQYLVWTHDCAQGYGVEPDAVEYELFCAGKRPDG